jgi:signal transduction histidine kinase
MKMPTARILVVDDEGPQLKALCDVLQQEGHHVAGCATPGAAIDALHGQRFDILLSDLNMPQMDGIALTREALAIDGDLVPVLMTGQASVPTAIEAMKVGAVDYVLKPFRIASIRPVLARALEMRHLRTSNRELQEDLARRNVQLEAANRELDAFAARVAHDLRNPLHAVLGFARLLSRSSDERLDADEQAFVKYILMAGERADRMVRDLLAFARLGESALKRGPVSLDAVIEAARRNVAAQAQGRSVDWLVAPLPTVSGDASLLEMAFTNLLSNALKYSARRDQARIEIGSRASDNGHVVWVRDNGVGFDMAQADKLFSPFHRLHKADEFEGTGVGLANVRRIVERHQGSVIAEARPDQGATFFITLPSA